MDFIYLYIVVCCPKFKKEFFLFCILFFLSLFLSFVYIYRGELFFYKIIVNAKKKFIIYIYIYGVVFEAY